MYRLILSDHIFNLKFEKKNDNNAIEGMFFSPLITTTLFTEYIKLER